MSGAGRRKGTRLEREIVALHKQLRIHADRHPLSGVSHFRGSGHDLGIYALGENEVPLAAEVKARANDDGFAALENWLAGYDVLFLRRNHAKHLVLVLWRIWTCILGEVRR
jgi:hypothetical protein